MPPLFPGRSASAAGVCSQRLCGRMLALVLCFSATLLETASAEKTWLDQFPSFPSSKTLEVVHFLTVKKKTKPEISLLGPVKVNVAKPPPGLQLSVIPHRILSKLKSGNVFCKDNGIALSEPVFSFPITEDTLSSAGKLAMKFEPQTTGLYYVVLSNCGADDLGLPKAAAGSAPPAYSSINRPGVFFTSGELQLITTKGFLPGEEVPKLNFYMYLMLFYLGLLLVWGVWCHKWTNVLFNIHHYITVAILAGFIEAACWYISLYHWNFIGHRWWSMMLLASFGTVAKQGLSYGVLLLACLGLGVTSPRLENKQIVQVLLLVSAFIFADGVRQMALLMQDRVSGVQDTWKIVLLVTPGSFFVSLIYVWILQALQDTIKHLNASHQLVKAEVYQSLRMALVLVIGIAMALVAYETIVVRRTELAVNWKTRYIFTDVLSHCCFAFLLTVIMFLWRPSERSQQMAYSVQLDEHGVGQGVDSADAYEMTGKGSGIQMTSTLGNQMPLDGDFQSVEVEIGEEDGEDDFDFKKSMEESLGDDVVVAGAGREKKGPGGSGKKVVPDVLE